MMLNVSEKVNSVSKTGIKGLDEILQGSINSGSSILLEGPSGSGKTLFGLQFACAKEEASLFISFLETDESLSLFSQKFNLDYAGLKKQNKIFVISGLEQVNKSITSFQNSHLSKLIKKHKIKRIVIDNINALSEISKDAIRFRNTMVALLRELKKINVMCLLIKEQNAFKELDCIVDVIFNLEIDQNSSKRTLNIVKSEDNFRVEGNHLIKMQDDGLEVFPNLRYLYSKYLKVKNGASGKVKTDISDLDVILEGGVFEGDTILISGPSGTGKTLLGLKFIKTGLAMEEGCLYVGFDLSYEKLTDKAGFLNLKLKNSINKANLEILNITEDLFIEEILAKILKIMADKNIRRIVIDDLSGFNDKTEKHLMVIKLLIMIFSGKTSLFTLNLRDGGEASKDAEIFKIMDNVISLKYIEIERKIENIIYVLKSKEACDRSTRKLVIDANGVSVGERFEKYQNILSGNAVKTEIKLVTFKTPLAEEIIDDFQKMNPDVKIEISDLPDTWKDVNQIKEKIRESKNIGLVPLDYGTVKLLAREKLLLEVDTAIKEEDRRDIFSPGLEACSLNNHLYAVPDDIKCELIIYRKDLLKKHGFTVPKNWSELVEICKNIMSKEKNPALKGLMWSAVNGPNLVYQYLAFLYSNGGEIFKKSSEIGLTEKKVVDSLTFMQELIYKHKVVPEEVLAKGEDRQKKVIDGNVIFYLCSSVLLKNIFKNARCELDIMPIPLGPGGRETASITYGLAYAIPKWSLYPGVSLELLKTFTTYENQRKIELFDGSAFPARKRICLDEEVLNQKPYYRDVVKFMEKARVINLCEIPHFEKIFPVLREAVWAALNNKTDALNILKSAQLKLGKLEIKPLYSHITNNVIEYLQENSDRPLKLIDVSNYLKLSPFHLSRVFKTETKKTIFEYLTYLRIERAKRLLRDIRLNISEVSMRCGFNDSHHFSKIFKKTNGVTPNEYRKRAL
ncbi:MAG: hypothetical protein A2044_01905 [Candidatus Firestonebacteria bacterium GWA2_43_8]|nr:MAG: hypothetical protein A2044_01905 [Candidatus Firestonebacteria bacterium GWA2_43_8]